MLSRGRVLIAPAYLFACLILGGSAQGIWQNMILQLTGVAIIAWAAAAKSDETLSGAARQLLLLAALAILAVALQMIPLPPSVWTHLGGRGAIAEGFRALGKPLPPEPVSLTARIRRHPGLVKFVKDAGQMLRFDPCAGVTHTDPHMLAFAHALDPHRSFAGELESVAHKIAQDLAEQLRIRAGARLTGR